MTFLNKIEEICRKNKKVAMFIDMDGTIVEYQVYGEKNIGSQMALEYSNLAPLYPIIEVLEKINSIPNIDLYILTLSTNNKITLEKRKWLRKYVNFIDKDNWIIIDKENGEYNKENRDRIKVEKISELLPLYNHTILLDDDHKILKASKDYLANDIDVFHLSSAII